ncbi:hypothetical protein I5P86_01340 [Pseudomonas glycinae]|uniref:hypothetical protein n=1 Tax=Pseudomonas glycinae TaxID=1785145 RepID=UPI0018D74199|nr:hypothetical protein [Pseudomonas glycinae]MBH3403687.1 hypothetical protein [Pseudomonas glycinae]
MSINDDTIRVSYFKSNNIQLIAQSDNRIKLVVGEIAEINADSILIIPNTGQAVNIPVPEIKAIIIDQPNTEQVYPPTQNTFSSFMTRIDLPILPDGIFGAGNLSSHKPPAPTFNNQITPTIHHYGELHTLDNQYAGIPGKYESKQTAHSTSGPTPTWQVQSITVSEKSLEVLPTTRVIHPPDGISPTDWNRKFNNDSSISTKNSYPQPPLTETILTVTVCAKKETETFDIPAIITLIKYAPS